MKRIVVLPIILLLLCGCSKIETAKPIVENISFVAEINYNNVNYVCDANVFKDGLNLVLIEPEEIGGLMLKIDKNIISAEYEGITYTHDLNKLPDGAIGKILLRILDDVKDKSIEFNEKNGVIEGKINTNEYVFTFSPSGLPLSLDIDDLYLKVDFKNVSLSKEN